jgi:hypothetical protein
VRDIFSEAVAIYSQKPTGRVVKVVACFCAIGKGNPLSAR